MVGQWLNWPEVVANRKQKAIETPLAKLIGIYVEVLVWFFAWARVEGKIKPRRHPLEGKVGVSEHPGDKKESR